MMIIKAIWNRIRKVLITLLMLLPQILIILAVVLSFIIGKYFEWAVYISFMIPCGLLALAYILAIVKDVKGKGKEIPVPPLS